MIAELTLALVGIAGFAMNDTAGHIGVGFIAGAVLTAVFLVLTGKLVDRDRSVSRHRAGKGRPATVAPRPAQISVADDETAVIPRAPRVMIDVRASNQGFRPLVRSSR